jgi:hypothetical protein
MKKALLSAAALGLLSSVAVAEPLKLDDGTLGDVAGGVDIDGSTNYSLMVSQVTETMSSASETSDTRMNSQDLMAGSTTTNYATALWSENVNARGDATASVMGTINIPQSFSLN